MLEPQLRFNEFKDEWRQTKLKDLVTITMGQSPNSINYTENSNYNVLVQGNADLESVNIYV